MSNAPLVPTGPYDPYEVFDESRPGFARRWVEYHHARKVKRVLVKSYSREDAVQRARNAYPHSYQYGFKCLTPI